MMLRRFCTANPSGKTEIACGGFADIVANAFVSASFQGRVAEHKAACQVRWSAPTAATPTASVYPSGAVVPNAAPHDIGEIIGSALRRHLVCAGEQRRRHFETDVRLAGQTTGIRIEPVAMAR